MFKPDKMAIGLRPADPQDCQRLWDWRNETSTREASLDTSVIPYQDHKTWFMQKMHSQETHILIITDDSKLEVGYVRFDISGNEAEISVGIDERARGRGYGSAAIRKASNLLLSTNNLTRITAHIKLDNAQSTGAFLNAGFVSVGTTKLSGTDVYKMILDRCR